MNQQRRFPQHPNAHTGPRRPPEPRPDGRRRFEHDPRARTQSKPPQPPWEGGRRFPHKLSPSVESEEGPDTQREPNDVA